MASYALQWIARQIEMMEQVRAEGLHQKLYLQLQRADYMSHWDEQNGKMELKNVCLTIHLIVVQQPFSPQGGSQHWPSGRPRQCHRNGQTA